MRVSTNAKGRTASPTGIVFAMASATAMLYLDETVLAVALPRIQLDMGLSSTDVQWLLASYLISFGALLLPAGHAADVFGIQRVFLFGLFVFTSASAAVGMAQSETWFGIARAWQGGGAAILAVCAPAIISRVCAPTERNRALSSISTFAGIALVGGPLLGGLLTQFVSWRTIFFLNVPVCLLVLAATLKACRGITFESQKSSFDFIGSAMLVASIALLSFALVGFHPWKHISVLDCVVLSASLLLLIMTFFANVGRDTGLINTDIFLERSVLISALSIFLFQLAGIGVAIFGAFYFQHVRLIQPLESGLYCILAVLPAIFLSGLWGRLIDRVGYRWPGAFGGMIAAGGLMFAGIGMAEEATAPVLVGFVVYGIGAPAIFISSMASATLTHTDTEQGEVSALLRFALQFGSILGIAILGTARFAVETTVLEHSLTSEIPASQIEKTIEMLEEADNTIILAKHLISDRVATLAFDAMAQGLSAAFLLAGVAMFASGMVMMVGSRAVPGTEGRPSSGAAARRLREDGRDRSDTDDG